MKKGKSTYRKVLLTGVTIFFILVVIIPLSFALFSVEKVTGNVAVIPIEGIITSNGEAGFAATGISSEEIIEFIEEAAANSRVEAIILEINSPGGSPVASDAIAAAVKKVDKPIIALITETGASGGYWVASATDYIIAHRMSITGSIGVLSSYLEFSGLLDKYGVGYERLISGEHKDLGTPFKKLTPQERQILQKKLDRIHEFFIEEVATNRKLSKLKVKELATGEFYLGVEAEELGLIDELGDLDTAKAYLQKTYEIDEVSLIYYEHEPSLLDLFGNVLSAASFQIGQGLGESLVQEKQSITI